MAATTRLHNTIKRSAFATVCKLGSKSPASCFVSSDSSHVAPSSGDSDNDLSVGSFSNVPSNDFAIASATNG